MHVRSYMEDAADSSAIGGGGPRSRKVRNRFKWMLLKLWGGGESLGGFEATPKKAAAIHRCPSSKVCRRIFKALYRQRRNITALARKAEYTNRNGGGVME